MIPKKMFFTKGVGRHKEKLESFELALRNAGIEKCNLVTVSSILPPECKIISKVKGLKELNPGQIVFAVMSKNASNEPRRLVGKTQCYLLERGPGTIDLIEIPDGPGQLYVSPA